MTRIEEAITEHWGERCPDFDESCPTCQAWNDFDCRSEMLAALRDLLKLHEAHHNNPAHAAARVAIRKAGGTHDGR